MTNGEITAEEVKPVKAPMLRLISGGKGPPTSGENWLINLPKGCIFSCQETGKEVELELFCLVFKHTVTVLLADALGSSPRRAVNAKGFSKRYRLVEILEEGGKLPMETENDQGTIRPSGMADNEDAS